MAGAVAVFGQILTPAGLPAAGVGVLVVPAGDAKSVVASTVSARSGLFILRYPEGALPDGTVDPKRRSTPQPNGAINLSVNTKPITGVLPTHAGLYGPYRIVAEKAPPAGHEAVAPRPILNIDEHTLAQVMLAAPDLFIGGVSAEREDPCSAYGSPSVANRTYFFTQVVPLLAAGNQSATGSTPGIGNLTHGSQTSVTAGGPYGLQISYRQDWWDMGRSLGDLLYTLPLAPGEETMIATVDWRRVDQARRQSSLDESVSQDTSIARLDAIDDAVTMATQKTGTDTTTMSSSQVGGGLSASIGPVSLGGSGSSSTAKTVSDINEATNASTQNAETINDQVHQASNTLRGTRAMAVAEVSESESSSVATRVVRNHNHAHTLTIEYFQVLAHYLIEARPTQMRPVMFVPLPGLSNEISEFTPQTLATRWTPVVLRALLEPAYANELRALLSIEAPSAAAAPGAPPSPSGKSNGTVYFAAYAVDSNSTGDTALQTADNYRSSDLSLELWPGQDGMFKITFDPVVPGQDPRWVIGTGTGSAFEYSSVQTGYGFSVGDGLDHVTIIFQDDNGSTAHSFLVDATPESGIGVPHQFNGSFQTATWPLSSSQSETQATQVSATPTLSVGLAQHLEDNVLYYAGAVVNSWDASAIYEWLAESNLQDTVEPAIVGQLGNMVALPLIDPSSLPAQFGTVPTPDQWAPDPDRRVITLPTPGVFAESALGACSAAEVIDNSRFWDWIKSPIPEDAPAITADMLASRYQSMSGMTSVQTSDLTPPAVQIPTEPQPFIQIGDQTMSELVKDLNFSGDASKAVAFLQGAAQAAATASSNVPKPSTGGNGGQTGGGTGNQTGGGTGNQSGGGTGNQTGGGTDTTAGDGTSGAAGDTGAGDATGAADAGGAADVGSLAPTTELGDAAMLA